MSTGNTFLAVFLGSKSSPRMAAWNALPEAERQAKTKEGIAAWKAWIEKHRPAIVEMGGPLGKTKKIAGNGIEHVSNDLSAFMVVRAASQEEAAGCLSITHTLRFSRANRGGDAGAADPGGLIFGQYRSFLKNKAPRRIEMPHTVRLHRVMGTKPEKIYRAFLEADALAKWLPPNGFTCTVHELAAKVGGRFGMSFRNFTTGQSQSFGGEYLELMPNERVVYTDKFDDPNLPGQIQVTVTLKKVSCGTELHIVQEGLPDVIPPEPVILAGRNPCAIWQGSLNPKSINSLNNRAAAATHARAELSRRLAERPVCRAMCSRYVLVVYKAVCNGRAGFSDLAADRAGFAFLLIASAGGLSVAGR